ncbi:MAG: prolyl oligopeptidase family serine peptidase, partial [Clostridia bacterium]
VVRPRTRGVEYGIEHWRDTFFMLTNEEAENFSIKSCPVGNLGHGPWQTVVAGSDARYLQQLVPFESHLVIAGREGGLSQLWTFDGHHLEALSWDEPLYDVGLYDNRAYATDEVLVTFQSMVTPPTVFGLSLKSGTRTVLKRQPVPNYDPSLYTQEQVWATAADGARVPISMVYRTNKRRPGEAGPLWLYGYGSYGATSDPIFRPNALVLLDRGVTFAIAHIRGGAEMGRAWYHHGKLLEKRNTFTDFIAAAEALIAAGYTQPDLLTAEGRSAGGLLMGAVTNLRPDLFRVVVAGVPFVDVVTTMLDDTIPLTSLEWEEWGNPADPEYYAYMRSYSPYDNVERKAYPHIVVTTGLNDPRVGYFEPAKWVQRLRDQKTDDHDVIMKTHMGAGHGGSSGRYDRLRELAMQYAFALARIGLTE